MTKTGGTTVTGKTPHVLTGGTCDSGVRVGQARKDSVTSPCRLQPPISPQHKPDTAEGTAPNCLGVRAWDLTSPRPALVLYLGPARPPKGATWVGRRGEPEATHTLSLTKLRDCEVD